MPRLTLFTALAALFIPAVASAAKPPHPTTPATPTVSYILRGTLTAYTAANGNTPGSVTISVKSATSGGNHAAKALKGHTYTLAVTPTSKITLHGHTFTTNDKGTVKFKAKKGLTDADGQTATQVLDRGPNS
jgi:hypothetical protein